MKTSRSRGSWKGDILSDTWYPAIDYIKENPALTIYKTLAMLDAHLYTKINQLPAELRNEVMNFIDFLLKKNKKSENGKQSGFGCLKGKIKMAPDFDAPLDDFKPCME
jgi:hypothetical protein